MTFRVVAGREDGLCMRLLAVLHAMRLAHAYGAEFGFLWPETDFPAQDQHTVGDPTLIFSAPYLERHLVAPGDRRDDTPILAHAKRPLDDIIDDGRRAGMLVVERPLPIEIANGTRIPSSAEFFAAIDWTDAVRQAIAAASALPISPGATAIHVRGGDVLHGTCSNMGFYAHKAISVFEAEALVERLCGEGKTVWLIGQEPDFIAHMVATNSAVRSLHHAREDLGLSAVQALFFDVIAMSRMAEVYSGRSGVAHLACQLGDAEFVDTKVLDLHLQPEAYLHDPLADPRYDGLSHNLKAHSYYKLFYLSNPADWTLSDLKLARLMLRWRPNGQFAKLNLCVFCARFDLWDEAEELAKSVIGPDPHEALPDVVVDHVMSDYDRFPAQQIAVLARADADRYPACAFIAACGSRNAKAPLLRRELARGLTISPVLRARLTQE